MNYREIITIEPAKMGGKPCIREEQMLRDYPDLTADDIERRLANIPA